METWFSSGIAKFLQQKLFTAHEALPAASCSGLCCWVTILPFLALPSHRHVHYNISLSHPLLSGPSMLSAAASEAKSSGVVGFQAEGDPTG